MQTEFVQDRQYVFRRSREAGICERAQLVDQPAACDGKADREHRD